MLIVASFVLQGFAIVAIIGAFALAYTSGPPMSYARGHRRRMVAMTMCGVAYLLATTAACLALSNLT